MSRERYYVSTGISLGDAVGAGQLLGSFFFSGNA